MIAYILRRLLYAVPILIGVNLVTFTLFFLVNTPDDMARLQLGAKRVTTEAIDNWKREHGYDKPLVYNSAAAGAGKLTETIFYEKSLRMFAFDFGRADDGRDIAREIRLRMGPSLAVAIPTFVVGLALYLTLALMFAFFRGSYIDFWGVTLCVLAMSISSMFYIIGGQYLISKLWHLVPISGFSGGADAFRFLLLPVVVSVIAGLGASTRLYRTYFLEEINKDYVRTARAKGLSEPSILFRHILKNAMIPILTGVVVEIPLLFIGGLITESFFGIPGLGSYTVDAINSQDFAVVRAMVFIGSLLYIVGLLLTDISYTLVDPPGEARLMSFQPIVLWTDGLVYILLATIAAFVFYVRSKEHLRAPWRRVALSASGMVGLAVLLAFVAIGLLDSLHFRPRLASVDAASKPVYGIEVLSVLDLVLSPLRTRREKTYSAPLATQLYTQEPVEMADGSQTRGYPRLKYGGAHLNDPRVEHEGDVATKVMVGVITGVLAAAAVVILGTAMAARRWRIRWLSALQMLAAGKTEIPWRALAITMVVMFVLGGATLALALDYHVFGTDKVGQDVLYQSLKSVRTALVIGTLTTLLMLPFAISLGIAAGYFGGWVDDVIQYVYTVLNSIPGVLLIAAAVLMVQVYIDRFPDSFPTAAERADLRLLFLCVILGVTSWTGLCRLLRGETLKLKQLDYIQAARAFGVRDHRIITRHILPNVMYLVLITVVMAFSGLVLTEAVLSYVGVGVDPSMQSFGTMINNARLEMAREPMVWWTLAAAFVFMVTLVLAANLFADAIRDAFDPRLQLVAAAMPPISAALPDPQPGTPRLEPR